MENLEHLGFYLLGGGYYHQFKGGKLSTVNNWRHLRLLVLGELLTLQAIELDINTVADSL